MNPKVNPIVQSEKRQSPPPVVAILGHVDHGKTTLLDAIRKTNVAALEAGGITQHTGVYQIEFEGKKITFLDTPGHVAFSQMRSRGAKVADLAVLVVAADEGVKPQTRESLKHIQSAGIPYLIALTKIDLPESNLEQAKKNLSQNGIMVEGFGGDIVVVPVSGKTGQGIKDLLEMISILAEMNGVKGSPGNAFAGVVVESRLDSRRGTLATILVKDGYLKTGDEITAGGLTNKTKAMFDEKGKLVTQAGPSTPVEILGFKKVPPVGSRVEKVGEEKEALKVLAKTEDAQKIISAPSGDSIPQVIEKEPEVPTGTEKKLRIILKADTLGTLEAIIQSLPREIETINTGVGEVTESDVLLAQTTGSQLVAFNIKIPSVVRKLAEIEGVKILSFKIIYELLEDIEKKVLKILEPTIEEEVLGRAEIIEEFEIKKEKIAGCRVVEGRIEKADRLHLVRKGEAIGDCRIKSMRIRKKEVDKAKMGDEFGAVLSSKLDFDIGDMLVSYRRVEE